MRDETDSQGHSVQAQHTLLAGGSGWSHHPGAQIDKLRRTVHDDGRARSGALRIRQRRPRAQENNLGFRDCFALCL